MGPLLGSGAQPQDVPGVLRACGSEGLLRVPPLVPVTPFPIN